MQTTTPSPAPLPVEQLRVLKRRAHALKVVVTLGAAGLNDSVLAEIDQSLTHHELMKLRLPAVDKPQREALTTAICTPLGAHRVQQIGFILTLYRKTPEKKAAGKKTTRKGKPASARKTTHAGDSRRGIRKAR